MEAVGASWANLTSDLISQVLVATLSTRNHVRCILSIGVLNIFSACVASWTFVTTL
jgi:hypothetical protein